MGSGRWEVGVGVGVWGVDVGVYVCVVGVGWWVLVFLGGGWWCSWGFVTIGQEGPQWHVPRATQSCFPLGFVVRDKKNF